MGFGDILNDLLGNLSETGFDDEEALEESVERIKNNFSEGDVERVMEQEAEKFDDNVEELAGHVFYSFFSNGVFNLKTGDKSYISREQSQSSPLKSLHIVSSYAVPELFESVEQETEGGYAGAEHRFDCALKVVRATPLPQRYENLAKKGLSRVERRHDLIEEIREICSEVDSVLDEQTSSDSYDARDKLERAEKLLEKAEVRQPWDSYSVVVGPGDSFQLDWEYKNTEENKKIMKDVQEILNERREVLESSGLAEKIQELCQELEKLSDPKSIDRDIETIEQYKIG